MQIYLAPLEGITGYVFRNAYAKYYGGVDKYFTPFISPHTKKMMDAREKRDILPENNEGICLVPQVLTNNVEDLIELCKKLNDFGYSEVNLNLGCPSKTVTTKGKGSGFLEYPERLEEFFDRFFKVSDTKLSIKTRIGIDEIEEAQRLFRIYEKFPFEEVIIHPRLGSEFYSGIPHRDVFEEYLSKTKHRLCYNGDINTIEDLESLDKQWEKCNDYMIGRGLLFNPALLKGLSGGFSTKEEELQVFKAFHDELVLGYDAYMCGDRNVLFKMKELWGYWSRYFVGQEKLIKKIKKTNTLLEYRSYVNQIIQSQSDSCIHS